MTFLWISLFFELGSKWAKALTTSLRGGLSFEGLLYISDHVLSVFIYSEGPRRIARLYFFGVIYSQILGICGSRKMASAGGGDLLGSLQPRVWRWSNQLANFEAHIEIDWTLLDSFHISLITAYVDQLKTADSCFMFYAATVCTCVSCPRLGCQACMRSGSILDTVALMPWVIFSCPSPCLRSKPCWCLLIQPCLSSSQPEPVSI